METVIETEQSGALDRWLAMWTEKKYTIALAACLLAGLMMGSVANMVYGNGARWSGTVDGYCLHDGKWALVEILPITVGFVAGLFALAPFDGVRLLIGPAVCLRAMGMGALLCGVVQADGLRGLCFAALVLLPYTVINGLLTVKAGEFALGLRDSLKQPPSEVRRGLVRHTLVCFVRYLLTAALSCGLFALSCMGFGKYLL